METQEIDLETNDLGNDDSVEGHSIANSGEDQPGSSENKTIDHFINEKLWDEIGKELEDYNANDMDLLRWKSLDDCIEFYYTYGKVKGFGVRKDTTYKSRKDGHIIGKKLVCRAQGHRRGECKDLRDRQRDPKPLTRYGCLAFIQFKLNEEGKYWKVERFQAEHNHPMVDPKQVSYIRSFRKISEGNESKIRSMHKAGIAPTKIMRHFVNEAGSHEDVDFTKKDLYNCVGRIKRETIKDGDAETVLAYLFGKKTVDPSFFISYTRDENGNLDKLFWCDGISRADFKTFGHVLAFDTTYKCNAYNKPFVVLVGVNHHRNTVSFGCALVVNEQEDTFVWVLEKLIEAGDGFRPLTVITDGDRAMANAIAKVLPESRHRLCLWHIMKNVKGNLKGKFLDGFIRCVRCKTPNDFENTWKELIAVHEVEGKRWVNDLYGSKEKWAEAYMRGHFYAGMRSTQRCESMHRTLKRMLDKKVFLYEFVQYYHEELNELRYEEGRQDYRTSHEQPVCDGILSHLKIHASKIYTRNAFATLCAEMRYEGYFLVNKVLNEVDSRVFYWLEHVEYENCWYLVVKDNTHDTMYCCCMKLESVGFPCRHMFAVLKYLRAKELPQGCVMKRWTIYAKEDIILPRESEEVEYNNPAIVQARYSSLISFCTHICHQASQGTLQDYREVKDQFAKIGLKLNERMVTVKERTDNIKAHFGIGDPVVIETGRGQRKKKKARTSYSVPTKKEVVPNSNKIDLNKSPKPSPGKMFTEGDNVSTFSTMIMNYMPDTYIKANLYEESCSNELKKMEDDPSVIDWKPHKEW